jgi:hypothetical protein
MIPSETNLRRISLLPGATALFKGVLILFKANISDIIPNDPELYAKYSDDISISRRLSPAAELFFPLPRPRRLSRPKKNFFLPGQVSFAGPRNYFRRGLISLIFSVRFALRLFSGNHDAKVKANLTLRSATFTR